jgi:hypothetical protein
MSWVLSSSFIQEMFSPFPLANLLTLTFTSLVSGDLWYCILIVKDRNGPRIEMDGTNILCIINSLYLLHYVIINYNYCICYLLF